MELRKPNSEDFDEILDLRKLIGRHRKIYYNDGMVRQIYSPELLDHKELSFLLAEAERIVGYKILVNVDPVRDPYHEAVLRLHGYATFEDNMELAMDLRHHHPLALKHVRELDTEYLSNPCKTAQFKQVLSNFKPKLDHIDHEFLSFVLPIRRALGIRTYVVEHPITDEIVGTVSVQEIDKDRVQIDDVIRHPDSEKAKGVGKILLQLACNEAIATGYNQAILTASNKLPGLINFYQNFGFEATGAIEYRKDTQEG